MTRRRWIADEAADNRAALTGEHAVHLARVLRARVGQEFEISTGNSVRLGRIVAVSEKRVEFELGDEIATDIEVPFVVLLSIFKFDRMEWAIEKLTELGVSRIIPLRASRSDAHLVAAAAKRTERWRRIAMQAAQQSRRNGSLEVSSPQDLKSALSIDKDGVAIVLAENERGLLLPEALAAASSASSLSLAIGPEGGWTEEELTAFQNAGWRAASLGTNILRAETAAIAATAIAATAYRRRES